MSANRRPEPKDRGEKAASSAGASFCFEVKRGGVRSELD